MANNVTLHINGNKFEGFEGIVISGQIDSIASALTFGSFKRFGTLTYQTVQAYRNDVLIFTGKITDCKIIFEDNDLLGVGVTPPRPNVYTAWSLPHVLEDCTIPIELYPLQTENSTLKTIVSSICDYYGIGLIIDSSAYTDANSTIKAIDNAPNTKISSFINSLCTQKSLILSHNENGELIITKKVKGNIRKYPKPTSSIYSVSGRKLYRTHIGLGQQGIENNTPIQGENITESITELRNITGIQSQGDNDTIQSFTNCLKYDTFKNIKIEESYNDFFPHLGDIKKINGIDYLVNNYNYSFDASSENCSLTRYRDIVYER